MPRKQINVSPGSPAPQDWSNLGVAVPRELKLKIEARASSRGLKPSQYARSLLIEAMAREDRRAA